METFAWIVGAVLQLQLSFLMRKYMFEVFEKDIDAPRNYCNISDFSLVWSPSHCSEVQLLTTYLPTNRLIT